MYGIIRNADNSISVLDNETLYKFDNLGKFEKEFPRGTGYSIIQVNRLPILSLLTCNGKYEIAIFNGDTFKTYQPNCNPIENIAIMINSKGNFIQMLSRRGNIVQDNQTYRYNQLIFVYKENTDVRSLLGDYIK